MQRRIFVTALVSFAIALAAHAQAQRTFVSSTGNDANPCSRTAPCRGFGAAIANTLSDGEVVVLDSAGYGGVLILQPVSIIAPSGVYAGVSVLSGGSGITIIAGPFDAVTLHGLTIKGIGGTTGIDVASAGEVHLESCSLSGFRFSGNSALTSTLDGFASIDDCTFTNNNVAADLGGSTANTKYEVSRSRFEKNNVGLRVTDAFGGTARAVVSDSVFAFNNDGIDAVAGAKAAVHRCSIAGNATGGSATGTGAELYVADSVLAQNATGLFAGTGTSVAVSATLVVNNTLGFYQGTSGTFVSFGNNALRGNGSDANFTIPTVPLQ